MMIIVSILDLGNLAPLSQYATSSHCNYVIAVPHLLQNLSPSFTRAPQDGQFLLALATCCETGGVLAPSAGVAWLIGAAIGVGVGAATGVGAGAGIWTGAVCEGAGIVEGTGVDPNPTVCRTLVTIALCP